MTSAQERRQRRRAAEHVNGVVSKLSPMQREFLIEYLVTSNATQAAETAGYANPNSQGSRLLTYDKIQQAISDYYFGPEMEAREVIQRLGQQGRAEYAEYFVVTDGGRLYLDAEKLIADGKGHLIKKVKETEHGQQVEFHDVQPALKLIGQHLGMFGPSGGIDDPTHAVGWSVDEWRAERERRRKEAAEIEDTFKDDLAGED